MERLAGVSRNAIRALEEGETHPHPSTVKKLTDALDQFEEETGGPTSPPEQRMMTYRVQVGALDLDVTVQGAVEDAELLREQVRRLIDDLRQGSSD